MRSLHAWRCVNVVLRNPMSAFIRKSVFILMVVAAMTGLWLLLRQLGLPGELSAEAIADWLAGNGALGPVLLMVVMIMAVVVGPMPTLPVSAASGMAFGMVGGTLIASVGALAGALIALAIARFLARNLVRHKLGDNPVFREDASQGMLFCGILLTRVIPLFSFALVSYAAGLTAVKTWRFALATWLGMLPMTVVFAGLGHSFQLHPVASASAGLGLLLLMITAPCYLNRYHGRRLRRWFARRGD